MSKLFRTILFLIVILITLGGFSVVQNSKAAINKQFNYQGKLTDSSRVAVSDGVYNIVFKLYTQAGGGTAAWTENWDTTLWTQTDTWTSITVDTPAVGLSRIIYTTGTNEATLKAGQTLWNITQGESAPIYAVDTGNNYIDIQTPYSTWVTTDDLTNKIYIKNGLFSVLLGSVTSLPEFTSADYYLSVNVEANGEMVPRKKIGAVPYAWNANNVVGDGYVDIDNTSVSQDAVNINYNPASGTYDAVDITYGSGGGTGNALTVAQSGTGSIVNLTGDSITTGTGMAMSVDGLTTGTGLDITSTSTAGLGSNSTKLLNLARSGTNTIASHTAYGLYSAVTNTGTTSTNIGGYFSASGATNNYGLIVENGNVGIGTATPLATLDVRGTIENGLVAWWSMDKGTGTTIADQSINSNTGTFGTSPADPTWTNGKFDKALSFDGSDDYVNCGSDTSVDIAGDITIEAWVNTNDLTTNGYIVSKRSYDLFLSIGEEPRFNTRNATDTDWDTCPVGTTLVIGIWNHIVAVYNTQTQQKIVYVNGVAGTPVAKTDGAMGDPLSRDLILGHFTAGTFYFDGQIDEVKIYNRALSAREVSESYRQKAPSMAQGGTVSDNSAFTALTVQQFSTGDILNILDGTTSVFKISDGGNITASEINDIIYVDGTKYTQDSPGIQNALDNLPTTGGKVILPEGTYNVDRAMDTCFADDGGSFTDETTACNNATTNDITLLPATSVVNDAYYFGYDYQTRKVTLTVGQAATGTGTVAWEYCSAASATACTAWTDLAETDGTNGYKNVAGTYDITYTRPSNWVKSIVNSTEKYWIRARCDDATYTLQPLGTQAYGLGSIYFPNNNIELSGVGASTIIKLIDNYNATNDIILTDSKSKISISNLTVDGNYSNQSSGTHSFILASGSYSRIDNCWITGIGSNWEGVKSGANNSIVSNCIFHGNDGNSLSLWLIGVNDFTVTGNTFGGASNGIYEQNSNNVTVSGNTFYSAKLSLYNSTNNSLVGNKFNTSYIHLDTSSNNNTVTGNSIYNGSSYGIEIDGSSYNTISSNTLKNNTTAEIYLNDTSTYNIIDGNNIQTDIAYGIQEAASADDYNVISNNTVIGATTSAISVLGANTTVSGNKTDTAGEGLHQISTSTNATGTALTVTQNGTGNIVNLTGDSITDGTGIALSLDGLTTGTGFDLTSTSIGLTSGKLVSIDWSPGSAVTATGDLFRINVGSNGTVGNLLNVTDNGTSLFSVSETVITSALPHSFTAVGDVSMAYDLLFTNQTASYIKSNAPLYLEAGESFESNDLTFKTYNQGSVVIDTAVTTGNAFDILGSTLTSGNGIRFTGSTSTGVTGNVMSLTSDIGSAGKMISLAPDFSGSAVTGYGIYQAATDSTANANTDYGYYSDLTLTGNAAKTGTGIYSTVSSASTTADTLAALDLAISATGAITTGTRTIYGSRSQPASTAASSGTQALNLYGSYLAPSSTLATAGTTNVYGEYITTTASHNADAGTVNQYGLYVANGTSSTNGTSTKYGLYVETPTGADSNYGAYFGGNVGIGTDTPSDILDIGGGELTVNTVGDIYNPQTKKDVWTTMTDAPANVAAGGSLVYTSGNYIYALRGDDTTDFYRYSISENSWTAMTSITANVTIGGSLVYTGGNYIYALRGTNATSFYRYSISGNSWSSMTSTPSAVWYGNSLLTYTGGNYIYASKGGGSSIFWRYSISGNSWDVMTSAPGGLHYGGSIVYAGGDYIYAFKGAITTDFYRYSISSDSWTSMTSTPETIRWGADLTYTGGDYIYAFRGEASTTFWRYSISRNSWTTMTSVPDTVYLGGSLSYTGDYIYAFTGDTDFYRYSLGSDTGYDKTASGGLMLRGNITAEENIIFASKPTTGDALGITSTTTGNALTVTQSGTGSIANLTGDSITTGTGMALSVDGLSSGTGLDITSTSTAGLGSNSTKLLNLARSGANAIASHTAYGLYSAVTNTGTTSTNIGGYFSASDATNNYGLIVENGYVGIGTATPTGILTVRSDSTTNVVSLLRTENLGVAAIGTGGSVDFYAYRTGPASTQFTSLESVVTSIDATNYSGKLNMKVASNGSLVTMIEVGNPNVVINRPLEVNVAGNTGISYDLNFLNTGTTQITSEGPLVISAGDSNHNENLTITTGSNTVGGDSGVATAGAATTLTDSAKAWTADEWIGGTITIIGGTGAGQVQAITDNTTTAITVADWTGSDPAAKSIYHLAYARGGDVIANIQNADIVYGGFKVAGIDDGGYIFRISPDGDVEIGGNGFGGSDLVVKQNIGLTGGILTVGQLATPTNGVATCGTVASGGHNDATYYYRVSAINDNGETLALAEFNSGACTAGAGLNKVTVTWDAVSGATAYKVYGRATGAELYMATVSAPNLLFSDDAASLTPSGALPSANTTGGRIAINTTINGTNDRRLEILENTANIPQMKLISDASNYAEFYVDSTGDLSIGLTGSGDDQDIRILDENLYVCDGGTFSSVSCPTTGYSITGEGNLVVEKKVVADSFERICADGYIWVPGSAKFGTMPGFCVMKYEAKCAGSVSGVTCDSTTDSPISQAAYAPWRYEVDQEEARVNCQRIGTGYHLISEPEWMTIAENITSTEINDMDNVDANPEFATGHSDNVMDYTTETGSHITTDNNAILLVTGTPWTADQFVQYQLLNTTDSSSCYITANTISSATCTLSGGTDDDWDIGDSYKIIGPLPVIAGADPDVSGCVLTSNMEHSDNDYVLDDCEIRGDGVYGEDATDNGFYGTGQIWATTGYSSGAANKAQLRTHVLSNGEVIWDFSGNVWEWTDAIMLSSDMPEDKNGDSTWAEYRLLDPTLNNDEIVTYGNIPYIRPPDDSWYSGYGIGKIYMDVGEATTVTRAFLRGGFWSNGSTSGVFALNLVGSPTHTLRNIGFRCAR